MYCNLLLVTIRQVETFSSVDLDSPCNEIRAKSYSLKTKTHLRQISKMSKLITFLMIQHYQSINVGLTNSEFEKALHLSHGKLESSSILSRQLI